MLIIPIWMIPLALCVMGGTTIVTTHFLPHHIDFSIKIFITSVVMTFVIISLFFLFYMPVYYIASYVLSSLTR